MVHPRLDGARGVAESARIGRDASPANDLLTFLARDHRKEGARELGAFLVRRSEERPDAVTSGIRELETIRRSVRRGHASEGDLALEELVRNLNEDSRAVADLLVGTGCASMLHPLERAERLVDDGARGAKTRGWTLAELSNESDAASIVLEPRIVQSGY